MIETESNEGKGDDFATMSKKGDDHARKANKVLPNLDLGFNLEDNIAIKANKGDDYASKPKFDFLNPAHNFNQEQNTPQLALV